MGRRKIFIEKKILNDLYWGKGLSPYKIGEIYNCSFTTVTNLINSYGIKRKSHSQARLKHKRKPFSNMPEERSYILGFRLGDLNCYKTSERSEAVIARCHSTDVLQVNLIKELFSPYGGVTISTNKNHYQVTCFLDRSFDFLVPKKFDSKTVVLLPFVAGYFDAEACYQLNQGKARIKVDSYDYNILKWISDNIKRKGIDNKFYQITDNQRLWRLSINRASAIETLIDELRPHMRHGKQIKRAEICYQNITERRKNGTVKY